MVIFKEVQVKPYIKDLSKYERATEYEKEFDITNWRFFMAFEDEIPVGAMLSKIDMYAYYSEEECRNEIQFVWYLDI